MKKENLQWLQGPVTHLHLRFPGEVDGTDPAEVRQFTHLTALQYLRLLSGESRMRVTDTNHALLTFDDLDNLHRPENEEKEAWIRNQVEIASKTTLQRIAEVKKANDPNVIVGIEADIIDDLGNLSLNEECLSKIEYVIASFHSFIWRIFTEEKRFTAQYLIGLYMATLDNPYVSVLGHPTRSSSKMIDQIQADDYRPLIKKMHEKGVAFEVNILHDLSSPEEELTREVVKLCVLYQTPLAVSLDFHHLREVDFLKGLSIDNEVSEADLELFLQKNGSVHFRMFRRLIKNITILKQLGVKKELVVNSSNENFNQWQQRRKELASTLGVSG